jgi:DNA-binding transcriptional regulator YiaG
MKKKTKTKTKASRGGRKPGKWVHLTVDTLKSYRKQAGVSRGALAKTLGVSSTSVQNWETGRSVPMKRYQMLLADLVAGGTVPAGPEPAPAARTNGHSRTNGHGGGGDAVHAARLTATGEVLKGYLATPQGAKVTQDQLVALTKALQAALA